MQLIYFKRDRAASQTTSSSASSKLTHTLIYRGVSYELPKYRSSHLDRTTAKITSLIGKTLIYRGMQYAIASATAPTTSALQKPQRLIYRGATYVL